LHITRGRIARRFGGCGDFGLLTHEAGLFDYFLSGGGESANLTNSRASGLALAGT
jgi:hypothetical protein